jgi:hypothetical protein
MIKLIAKHKLTFWTSLISFAALALLMVSTNPVDKAIYTVLFFGLALVFMIAFGHLLISIQVGEISAKNRYRIIAISLIILTLLMFRSAQSLNWVDAVILFLISFGLAFYISRRS